MPGSPQKEEPKAARPFSVESTKAVEVTPKQDGNVADLSKEVEALKAQLSEKDKTITNQSEWLKKLQSELDNKKSSVDPKLSLLNKDSEINAALSSVNDVQGELKKLREECQETKTELVAAKELLETQEDELTRSKLRVGQVEELIQTEKLRAEKAEQELREMKMGITLAHKGESEWENRVSELEDVVGNAGKGEITEEQLEKGLVVLLGLKQLVRRNALDRDSLNE